MNRKFVRVLADVYCDWEGLAPNYRVYVNDELFAERTWVWTNEYLEEMLQIEAPVGEYNIRYELVPPHLAHIEVKKIFVDFGPGTMIDNHTLKVHDESQ
jgi:hypothetical protein